MKIKRISIIALLFLATALFSYGQVKMATSLSNDYALAGQKATVYLKVGLEGIKPDSRAERTPINIAIVLDRSGSMSGNKLAKAKEAAILAVNMLESMDIVSIVLYDDLVSVLVPATKVSDKSTIINRIKQIGPGGSTALFAGVSKGAMEVRKFLDRNRVNRVILLSDGLANVGPDTTGSFADLGASLVKEGISVTTIGLGLGYNEDLMTILAQKSDGNHAFVERSEDLVRIFNYEFGDVLSVVAQEVTIEIECREGVRPVRVLGRDADIAGNEVFSLINQLYGNQEKYVILEMELTPGASGATRDVARVNVGFTSIEKKNTSTLSRSLAITYTGSTDIIQKNINKDVMAATVMQIATINNIEALKLRDKGNVDGAKDLLLKNSLLLKSGADDYDSDLLFEYGEANEDDAANLDEDEWNERRKLMKKDQHSNMNQQSY